MPRATTKSQTLEACTRSYFITYIAGFLGYWVRTHLRIIEYALAVKLLIVCNNILVRLTHEIYSSR